MTYQFRKSSILSIRVFAAWILFFSASDAFAKVTGFMTWQENEATILLPKIEGKNSKTIPQLYKTALERSDTYKEFRPFFGKKGSIANQIHLDKISDKPEFQVKPESVPFAMFANNPSFMNSKYKPFQNFKRSFGGAGAKIFIIPFGLDALLTDKEDLKTYFDLISKSFPALISPGGTDVDPSLYGEKNQKSDTPNTTRDNVEIQLIKNFTAYGQGVFYGVCRGHQVYAVAMGGTLIQDLPVQLTPPVLHRLIKNPDGSISSSWHSITMKGEDNALYQAVQKDSFMVNSRHHQAVKSLPSDQGAVIALAGGNVIEAIEKKDSQGQLRVLTVQFHPEDMGTPESEKLIHFMIDQARQVRRQTKSVKE
jgi:putative glutamine amidotransferase